MAAYAVDVRPRARRSLRQFDPAVRKAVAQVIDGLAVDPRPAGADDRPPAVPARTVG